MAAVALVYQAFLLAFRRLFEREVRPSLLSAAPFLKRYAHECTFESCVQARAWCEMSLSSSRVPITDNKCLQDYATGADSYGIAQRVWHCTAVGQRCTQP